MRILELALIRYGRFTDRVLTLPCRDRDIHLIVGPNEAGKSTVRSAISDWLFGIPMRTPLAFLHPMPELRIGGVIERRGPDRNRPGKNGADEDVGERLAFDRTKGNRNTLRTRANAPLQDGVLQPWLGSLQAQAFNRMYALDHATLIAGGNGILSASDDIGRMLFQSAAGIEHLGDALKALQQEAEALWAPRKSGSRAYYQALEAFEAAQAACKRTTLRTRDWQTQQDTLQNSEERLTEARDTYAELRQRISRLERIRRVRPLLQALDTAHARREALLAGGHVVLLDEGAARVLTVAMQDSARANGDRARLRRDIEAARANLADLRADPALLALAADITHLNELRLQFRAHPTDMIKRTEEIRLAWSRVQALAEGLGWPTVDEAGVRQRLPTVPVRARLIALIRERAARLQAHANARGALAERQRQIQQAQEQLSRLGAGVIDPALETALEDAARLGDHDALMASLQADIERIDDAIEVAMTALGPWRQPLESLESVLVPDAPQLQRLIERRHADDVEARALGEALAVMTDEIARLELELQQLVSNFQPVSREQVLQARGARDALWQDIKREPQTLTDRVAAFEAQIAAADQLADNRLDRAQYDADRQSRSDTLAHKARERSALLERQRAIADRIEQAHADWVALTRAAGLPELPLEMAPTWLQQRDQILALAAERASAERRRDQRQAAARAVRDRLWARLPGAAGAVAAPELALCLRQARALLTLAVEAQGERKSLEQQIRGWQHGLAHLQQVAETARQDWEAWTQSWQVAIHAAGYAAQTPVDQVEAELSVMQDMERALERIRSIRSERLETMQADLDGLAERAASLAERVAPDLAGQSAEAIAMELARRLDVAEKAAASAADLRSRLQRSEEDMRQAERDLQDVHARLSPLMSTAGVTDLEALGRAIERSDERRVLERQIQSAEEGLAGAGDGLALTELRSECESIGADELQAEFDRLVVESNAIVDQIAELSDAVGAQRNAFAELDGGDLTARSEARRQEAIATMADTAERFLRLQMAARLLKWSIEKFRELRQGPMLAKASAVFQQLTLGSFSRLVVDSEAATPRLLGIRPSGEQVEIAGLSEGSRDQLYLALRLAALELQVEQGFSLPLIADDLFINFDDRRTAAGLSSLGELSKNMQVIFLTHHDHLVPLARAVLGADLNVIEL